MIKWIKAVMYFTATLTPENEQKENLNLQIFTPVQPKSKFARL